MTKINKHLPILVLFASFFFSGYAAAHAGLVGANPARDATVSAPLEKLELTYNRAVKITSVKLVGASGEEVTLDISGIAEGKEIVLAVPELAAGTYEVQWRGMSGDGHAISGKYSFTLE